MTELLVARLNARLEKNGFIIINNDLNNFDPDDVAEIQVRSKYSIKFVKKGLAEEEEKKEQKQSVKPLPSSNQEPFYGTNIKSSVAKVK